MEKASSFTGFRRTMGKSADIATVMQIKGLTMHKILISVCNNKIRSCILIKNMLNLFLRDLCTGKNFYAQQRREAMIKKEQDESIKITAILEAAFLVIVAQNATLLAAPLISLLNERHFTQVHFVLITVSIINIMEIISNLNAYITFKKIYTAKMLVNDILTLAVFYLETYIFNEMCGDNLILPLRSALIIDSSAYILISMLFIAWNFAVLQKNMESKQKNSLLTTIVFDIVSLIFNFVNHLFHKQKKPEKIRDSKKYFL